MLAAAVSWCEYEKFMHFKNCSFVRQRWSHFVSKRVEKSLSAYQLHEIFSHENGSDLCTFSSLRYQKRGKIKFKVWLANEVDICGLVLNMTACLLLSKITLVSKLCKVPNQLSILSSLFIRLTKCSLRPCNMNGCIWIFALWTIENNIKTIIKAYPNFPLKV